MIVTVVRSGGFAGLVARGEVDTNEAEDGGRLEETVRRLEAAQPGGGRPQPDRYIYRLQVRPEPEAAATEITVAEQDLDPDLAWLVDRVLG
ncbi:protealysin inhibitor emfourin [Kribbella deserti]|uniref:Protealysin inhibitor emfourin n=1 Tax=Kribbella deserti TaxID=1926257 RepID=A0ABV6QLY9_9ACTN